MATDLLSIEDEVRKYWEANKIVEQVRSSTEGNEKFFMIDGPPYLTGPPHMGQFQNKTTKDAMLRFKQMQGYDVWDQAGFDTHGLPNELKTEEKLGIENKNEIGDTISVTEFIEACKDRAVEAQDVWQDVMWRLAVWQDFEDPYLTYDPEYIESVWNFVQTADDREMLYAARKPIYWCGRCQTSLSGYEVTDEYREVRDDAIFVKFPLTDREDEYLLIWTTTPWTIPGNMAIVVHPDYEYARVKTADGVLIIADALVEQVMEHAGYEEHEWEVLGTFQGTALQGKAYSHPLADEVPEQERLEDAYQNVHRVIADETLVTLEDGSGLVHAASGHGPEDYEVVKQYDIPVFSPVNKEGNYTEYAGKYSGENVYDANSEIVNDLDDTGTLFHAHQIAHEFPHCWRCKSRIIYRAARQWFLDIDPVKDTMLEENKDVAWHPDTAGTKRFHNWLTDAEDWCISRQNYWGIPVPVWECDDCDERIVLGSFAELEDHAGELPDGFDPHKHHVDKLSWNCECGGEMERVPDILDVWMDSGCAPFASVHYPFDQQPFEDLHPMNFIVEGSDQIRGWFYSLMFCGVTMFDEAPYDSVCLQAFVLDEHGQKMSKSIGNVIDPVDVMDDLGADVPRFWILENTAQWENAKVDLDEMRSETRRLLNVYYNTAEFVQSYAPEAVEEPDELRPEDKWVLSQLHSLLADAPDLFNECDFHVFCRRAEEFILEDLSRWYVKIVRDRVKNGDAAAVWTLQSVLHDITLALAPITPYITERVYQDLSGEEPSVHMESYPEGDEDWINEQLIEDMTVVRDLIETVNKLRQEQELNLRWPAKKIVVSVPDETENAIDRLSDLVTAMANVKRIEYGDVNTRYTAKPDYSSLGPRFGSDADTVAGHIEAMDHDEIDQLLSVSEIWLDDYEVREEDVKVEQQAAGSIAGKPFRGGEVFLDTEMTDDLESEALVRELIRAIQEARKQAGLEVEDEIDLSVMSEDVELAEWRDDITDQVKVAELTFGEASGEVTGEAAFEEDAARFGFTKV